MIDPRLSVINKRFSGIKRVLVFASGKGGVGKSSTSVVTALSLAEKGFKTGLLDLDFHGASDHIFLGADLDFPEESYGILPYKSSFGLNFMSIVPFTGEHGIPMRGEDISNALIELLAITIWNELDFLVIDMPPGIGDEVLDIIRFLKKREMIILSSPSLVSARVVKRLIEVFKRLEVDISGIVENMGNTNPSEFSYTEHELSNEFSIPILNSIPRYDDFEQTIGDPELLLKGSFGNQINLMLKNIGIE